MSLVDRCDPIRRRAPWPQDWCLLSLFYASVTAWVLVRHLQDTFSQVKVRAHSERTGLKGRGPSWQESTLACWQKAFPACRNRGHGRGHPGDAGLGELFPGHSCCVIPPVLPI